MATEHGLRFHPADYSKGTPRFYVTDETVSVLRARRGDVVLIANGQEAHVKPTDGALDPGEVILMRDGKAFITPVREE
jgi:hypothetical protein